MPQDRTIHKTTMARSSHGSSSSTTSAHDSSQRRQGRRPSTRHSASDQRPRRSAVPDSGVRSPLEDVTDVVLATEYHWSPEPWPQPRGRTTTPYYASMASTSTLEAGSALASGRRMSPARKIPKRVRGEDLKDGEYRLSTPPRTPQLGRLGTPDLEFTRNCDKFCDCCSDEHKYLDDRSKMDSQSRFTRTLSFGWGTSRWLSLVVVRRGTGVMHD